MRVIDAVLEILAYARDAALAFVKRITASKEERIAAEMRTELVNAGNMEAVDLLDQIKEFTAEGMMFLMDTPVGVDLMTKLGLHLRIVVERSVVIPEGHHIGDMVAATEITCVEYHLREGDLVVSRQDIADGLVTKDYWQLTQLAKDDIVLDYVVKNCLPTSAKKWLWVDGFKNDHLIRENFSELEMYHAMKKIAKTLGFHSPMAIVIGSEVYHPDTHINVGEAQYTFIGDIFRRGGTCQFGYALPNGKPFWRAVVVCVRAGSTSLATPPKKTQEQYEAEEKHTRAIFERRKQQNLKQQRQFKARGRSVL